MSGQATYRLGMRMKTVGLFRRLVRSQLYISLSAVFLFVAGMVHLGADAWDSGLMWFRAFLVLSGTLLIYNVNHLILRLRIRGYGAGMLRRLRKELPAVWLFVGIVVGLCVLCAFLVALGWRETLFLSVFGLLSLAYNFPEFIPMRRLRSVPLLKVFLIALVWAAVGALYPSLLVRDSFADSASLFWGEFLFILSITLPFDIRDYQEDKKASLLTVPGLVGLRATKLLAVLSSVGFGLLLYAGGMPLVVLVVLVSLCVGGALFSGKGRGELYYTGFLDGLIYSLAIALAFS